jgi:two-component system response regulator YesN
MTNIRLLIADDEINIREGLKNASFDWRALGIDKVFTARDGVEAYKLCVGREIEIILTDIRMPGMDGLELIRRITYSPVRFILLSGFDDFKYTKEALSLGVTDYLLKPIKIDELHTAVKKAVTQIESARYTGDTLEYKASHGLEKHQMFFGDNPDLSLTENAFDLMILRAFEYINDHYNEDVSVKCVSEYLGKSNNYFSSSFKHATGLNFVTYLARVRIEYARKLLWTTSMMTYEIAEAVGFNDYKYFSTVFKKFVGVSPKNYRRRGPAVPDGG